MLVGLAPFNHRYGVQIYTTTDRQAQNIRYLLNRWVREPQPGAKKPFPDTGSPGDEEVARLKRELARVTKVRDFLTLSGSH